MDIDFAAKFFGALFAVMNPFVTLPIFLSLTTGKTVSEQRQMALEITTYTTVMCIVIAVTGHAVIEFFGVTIAAFSVAGGLVLAGIAFSMLNGKPITSHERSENEKGPGVPRAPSAEDSTTFYPMTFPMIVGPGTIATLLIYATRTHGPAATIAYALVLGGVLLALLVVLLFASAIGRVLSVKMRVIMSRLMGMILLAIATEMVFQGARTMLPGLAAGG